MYEDITTPDVKFGIELSGFGAFGMLIIALGVIIAITWLMYEARQRQDSNTRERSNLEYRLYEAQQDAICTKDNLIAVYRRLYEESSAEVERLEGQQDQQADDTSDGDKLTKPAQ